MGQTSNRVILPSILIGSLPFSFSKYYRVSTQTLSIFDTAHSHEEDRWITLGLDRSGSILVVVHTFHQIDAESCQIRIISAWRATAKETRQYQEGQA